MDLLGLHDPRAHRIGMYHLMLNLAIVAAQAVNFWLRLQADGDATVLPPAIYNGRRCSADRVRLARRSPGGTFSA